MSEASDQIFVGLVKESWKHYNEQTVNRHMDDLLVGAVIAATVDNGFSLIDLNSDGVNHYLRFEDFGTRRRLIFRLNNLSEDLVSAKVMGRLASIVVGVGLPVQNTAALWQVLKAEFRSGFLDPQEPGIITCDADLTAGYIYAQVPLLLNIDQYFGPKYSVNYELLMKHLSATAESLEKYLRGRLA